MIHQRQEVEGTFVRRVEPGEGLAAALAEELAGADDRRGILEATPSPYGDESAPRRIADAIADLAGTAQ